MESMITLEEFKKYINLIIANNDIALINLLKQNMGLSDDEDIIGYWLYELDCGKNNLSKQYKLETVEDLYNQIIDSKN